MVDTNEDEIQIRINGVSWRFFRGASGAWICFCEALNMSTEGETIVEAVENAADCVYLMLIGELEEYGIVDAEEEVLYSSDDEEQDFEDDAEF